jgi:glyoxylase I family protein
MASISGFHHTAIRTTNFDAVLAFYTEALGLKVKITWGEAPKRAVMIDAGDGNYVEVFERSEPASEAESALMHFALRTDDCAAMTEIARAAGAQITMEPKEVLLETNAGEIPVKISFFKGVAGEVVELFENAVL